MAQATQLSPLLAQALLNRGIDNPEQAQEFLNPEAQLLPSPLEEFPDLAVSLELLQDAIATQQKIAICGDYDADGMTSTALLLRALRFLGAQVDYASPSHMTEGDGISRRIMEDFHAEGIGLVLTVDNGIAAIEPIRRARELGLTVIVTDHHDIPDELPPANAILNPKLIAEASPYRGVAGVGVAYILAVCLAQCLGKTQDLTAPLLELFTLGTIADLAPLTGVNRRWVRRGLKLLPKSRIPGVQALIQVAGLSQQEGLKPEAIGFRLGPRINAVGRLADPQIVIELLTTDDEGIALERAMQCEGINRQRQQLCEQIEQEAIALCEHNRAELLDQQVLLLVQPGWHHGVIGIVASRLVERYGVPVFIGTFEDEEPEQVRGSARGIPEFNVFEALNFCKDLMGKFGGHRAAGGFTFPVEQLEAVRSRLATFARQQLQPEHLKPLINIDVQANLSDLTLDLYTQIDRLHPCGIENPDPVFWTPNVRILEQKAIGRDQSHLKVTLMQDSAGSASALKAIAWRWGEYCPLPARLDVAYKLRLNEWQGVTSVELELVGVRLPDPSPQGNPQLQPQEATTTLSLTKASSQTSKASSRAPSSLAEPDADTASTLWTRADFHFSKRHYTCSLSSLDPSNPAAKELRIRNPEGQILAVQLQHRKGVLGRSREAAKEVDVSDPYYFNLIRAALNALEVKQKTQLLFEKDQLVAEKDKQVATLQQQLALLDEKINQLSTAQQQKFHTLQAELQAQEGAIQAHEAHIAELQEQLEHHSPPVDTKEIRRMVRSQIGETVWGCLQSRSQRDLCAAYKNYRMIQSEGSATQLADYSEAGLRLSFTVEREVIHPFFKDLYEFLLVNGGPEVGGLMLGPKKKYTLGMLPPLIAKQWYSLRDDILQHRSQVPEDDWYCSASMAQQVNQRDRRLIQKFLRQWQHPVAEWLAKSGVAAASSLDQINKLRNTAAHAESFLYGWQFDLLQTLVIGNETKRGIFQEIFSKG